MPEATCGSTAAGPSDLVKGLRALSAAVRFHIEHRVFLNGGRTVVFR